MWMNNGLVMNKISVLSTFTLEKSHLFKPNMIELPIAVRVSPLDFLDTVDMIINNEVDEINIIFISDLKDMACSQYMAQPKSIICRKLLRSSIEEDFGILIVFGIQIVLDI